MSELIFTKNIENDGYYWYNAYCALSFTSSLANLHGRCNGCIKLRRMNNLHAIEHVDALKETIILHSAVGLSQNKEDIYWA